MDHVITPMWILIEWQPHDDTMSVVCHWHHEPSNEEIIAMVESLSPSPYDRLFFITRS